LRENAPFRRFEAAFFTYGSGFMVVLPAMPILLVDHLNLSYSVVSFGRGVMSAIFLIIFTPLLGRVLDRRDPVFLSMVSFFTLIAYPTLLIAAWFLRGAAEPLFYLSFAAFGIAMAGVTLTWNVGPMYFAATPQEIPRLMSVHVTLTGLRGLLVPILGYFLLKIGVLAPFVASAGFFFSAALMMRRQARRAPDKT
ncbi:MAG TPA: MFS transporter, partial [bacterium]|nr:MFS transporter [bacterium]